MIGSKFGPKRYDSIGSATSPSSARSGAEDATRASPHRPLVTVAAIRIYLFFPFCFLDCGSVCRAFIFDIKPSSPLGGAFSDSSIVRTSRTQVPHRLHCAHPSPKSCYPVSRKVLRDVANDYHNWVTHSSQKWGAEVVAAPEGRRDEFVEPYFRNAKPDQVVVIVKAREPANIMTSIGAADKWHLEPKYRWVDQYNFYLQDAEWGPMFVRVCPYFPFSTRICLNQHHWIAHKMKQAGIHFTQSKNAFLLGAEIGFFCILHTWGQFVTPYTTCPKDAHPRAFGEVCPARPSRTNGTACRSPRRAFQASRSRQSQPWRQIIVTSLPLSARFFTCSQYQKQHQTP